MASASDLELQADAPLLESRGRDSKWRIWRHLPRRDTSLATFLVKAADVLVGGLLTLNVFNATHFLTATPKEKDENRLNVCFASSAQPSWKVAVLAVPFILYPVTLWINGMAKMAESDHCGLSSVSFAVILEFIWFILVSGLLTHCISEASYVVIVGMATAIGLLLLAWSITFNQPRCLRKLFCSFCCCGLPRDIAATEANDQSIAAAELARLVAIAQEAFAAQVALQNEAFAARERDREAAAAKADAIVAAAQALKAVEGAESAMRACKEEMNIKKAAKADADSIKQEMEASAPLTEQPTEVEQNTSSTAVQEANAATENYSRIEQEATDAIQKYEEAKENHKRSLEAARTANEKAEQATHAAQTKNEEYERANQKVEEATDAAKTAYDKAAAARTVVAL